MTNAINNQNPSAPQPDTPELLTLEEVCEHLRISRTTLYNLIRSRQLPTIKFGRRRLVHPTDIARLLDDLRSEEWS